jgi:hypothetical protein
MVVPIEALAEALKEAAQVLVEIALTKLIEMGKIEREEVRGRWYVEFNQAKSDFKRMAGAATLDDNNHPVVYLSPRLTVEGLVFVIAHEVVHLAQICKGDFVPLYGFSIWKGQEYVLLSPEHPDYSAQPWEAEANEFNPILLEFLISRTKL